MYENSFWHDGVIKLRQVNNDDLCSEVSGLLRPNEVVLQNYKSARDSVAFTNQRIICTNITGVTGKKKQLSFINYSSVLAYSLETTGIIDADVSFSIFVLGIGKISFGFWFNTDLNALCNTVCDCISNSKAN